MPDSPEKDAPLHTDEIVQALRRELRQLQEQAGEEGTPAPGVPAGEQEARTTGLRQLVQQMEAGWVIRPRPFTSGLPVIGGAIAGFRTLWNEVSTRWYVQPILEQQTEFNASVLRLSRLVVNVLDALEGEARHTWADAAPYDRVAVTLSRTLAELELVLQRLEERLEVLERRRDELNPASIEARIARLEAQAPAPAATGTPPPTPTEARPPSFDYLGFEERFRGASSDVKERQRPYLEYLDPQGPVVDLGCGRGEFLQLLAEAGIPGRGVDSEPAMVDRCRDLGLDATQGDLMQFLAEQQDASLGAVFSAQVVEHLPPAVIAEVVRTSYAKLRPGGVFLAETVNPMCLLALSHNYTMDLSHRQPVHPDTLAFLAESAGFTRVEIRYSAPVPEPARLQPLPPPTDGEPAGRPAGAAEWHAVLSGDIKKLNDLLFGYQDYAVIARKPS